MADTMSAHMDRHNKLGKEKNLKLSFSQFKDSEIFDGFRFMQIMNAQRMKRRQSFVP